MNKFLQKASSGVLTLSTTLLLTGVGMMGTAVAAPIKSASASLSNVQGATASTHTLKFNVANTTAIKAIGIQYQIKPSGTSPVPSGLLTNGVSLTAAGTVTFASTAETGWTAASTLDGTILVSNTTGHAPAGGDTVTLSYTGVTNNSASVTGSGTECDAVLNSDTCYIKITTYSDAGTTAIDTGVVSYTVITATTVTATVDPSLTLTVAGVASTTAIGTNDSNASCVGSANVVSTATAMPFGNIQVGVAKCAQQSLTVATNANNGYTVYQKFTGTIPATDMMTGVTSANNIDPFTGDSATWSFPKVFATTPTGAANVDSGWLGVRTTNPGVSNFGSSNVYAPPAVTTEIGNAVMVNAGTDNGLTPTFVTYKILAGASQPADTYTGTSVYNVVASY